MNKKIKKEANKVFPTLSPTRAAGFTFLNNGKTIIIACMDEPISVVIDKELDLHSLIMVCEMALKARKR